MRSLCTAIVVLAFSGIVARGGPGPPPKRYFSQPGVTDIHGVELVTSPGEVSATMLVPNAVEIWQHDPTDVFAHVATIPEPNVYGQMPILLTDPQFHDLFLVTNVGPLVTFRVNTGGTSTTLTTYNGSVAPPRGSVIYTANNFNGSSGPDVAILVEPDVALVFGDNGAGALNPAFATINLASSQGDLLTGGDFNNDGQADLLVGETATGTCYVLRNNAGVYSQAQTLSVSNLNNMICVDLNGDGFDDVVALRDPLVGSDQVVVALSTGSDTNPYPATLPPVDVDDEPVALSTADLEPFDGDLDVMVACPGRGTLIELLNDGGGSLAVGGQYYLPAPGQGRSITASSTFIGVTDAIGHWVAFIPSALGNASPAFSILAGPGPGSSNFPRLRAFSGTGYLIPPVDFDAYATQGYGVNVAAGDVDGMETLHATSEVLTAPGPSPVYGPQVRAWRRDRAGLTSVAKINFFAYGTLRFGANVASDSIDFLQDEILTGAGPGAIFGPHARAFTYDGTRLNALAKVSFFAYFTLKHGVNVSATNLLGGLDAQVLTAPGPGVIFGPQVRAWTYGGTVLGSMAKVNFFPFTPPQYGGRVAGGDFNAAGGEELVCSPGPGPSASHPAQFRGYTFETGTIQPFPGFDVTPFPSYYGARPGTGFVYGVDFMELLAAPGPDPTAAASINTYSYDTGTLIQNLNSIAAAFPTFYGANVAAGNLAF